MKYFLHPQAREELEQAILFYQKQQAGLEKRLIDAVDDATHRVCNNPMLYRKVDDETRKCRILRFPYALVFREKAGKLEILAVMHLRKQPNYWNSRK
ncbi:type II toxin-antitoxin system RelE/ParE family toxin [Methylomonas sp. MED-D]|uniref:type II toxin-antitoxin system RelE/ParE family toxin n=1 Tax=unclassified Methylomonas TaxID=2608980 RepID=UPI0008D97705|nr:MULTISPECIES: type II toxin-antitoxin system RelE/ParE family toxin [unclassified Methylomonas]MDT4332269.1 type II toxin-antitoxin system RelE/ParE family toxin [Methylomonas sp. MV1]OHX37664.1 plasmid stabilization protein [Methylomonas sp. LWB]